MTDVFVKVPWVSDRVDILVADACVELFAAYATELAAVATLENRDEPLLSGVIGCVGSGLRATCLLAASEDVLHGSCPCTSQARDWVGEMANQLLGRLKMKLLGVGVDVTLTTPLAFSGVQLTPSPRGSARPSLFEAKTGVVMVWTEVDAVQTFAFGEPKPTADTGDMILF